MKSNYYYYYCTRYGTSSFASVINDIEAHFPSIAQKQKQTDNELLINNEKLKLQKEKEDFEKIEILKNEEIRLKNLELMNDNLNKNDNSLSLSDNMRGLLNEKKEFLSQYNVIRSKLNDINKHRIMTESLKVQLKNVTKLNDYPLMDRLENIDIPRTINMIENIYNSIDKNSSFYYLCESVESKVFFYFLVFFSALLSFICHLSLYH